jgi:hypothetical protein
LLRAQLRRLTGKARIAGASRGTSSPTPARSKWPAKDCPLNVVHRQRGLEIAEQIRLWSQLLASVAQSLSQVAIDFCSQRSETVPRMTCCPTDVEH